MKTITLLITLLLSLNLVGQKMQFGLKGSGVWSNIHESSSKNPMGDSKNAINYQSAPGFQLGLVCKYSFNDKTGILLEPGFIQKGAFLDKNDLRFFVAHSDPIDVYKSPEFVQIQRYGWGFNNMIAADTKVRMGYINLPVLFFYKLPFGINLETGTGLDYKLYDRIIQEEDSRDSEIDKHFGLNIIAGLSADITKRISIGSSYSYDLSGTSTKVIYTNQFYDTLGPEIVYNYNHSFDFFIRFYFNE